MKTKRVDKMNISFFKFFLFAALLVAVCTMYSVGCGKDSTSGGSGGNAMSIELRPDVTLEMVRCPYGLWFGKFEVTQAQWEAVMGSKCPIPSCDSEFVGDNHPAVDVSWEDCQEFLKKLKALPAVKKSGLTFRLPTEEEWEYACRAGAVGDYCLLADGTEITESTLDEVSWFNHNSDRTHSVGQKLPNAFGLYDMHGNVFEWTDTADGEERIIRGGSCEHSAGACESSRRSGIPPDFSASSLGFRLCGEDSTSVASPPAIAAICLNMVQIPGKDYRMGKTEVTQAQWEAIMGENPSEFKGANNPVENVSWDDCQKFLEKLNAQPAVKDSGLIFRLPTEEEWEYACRAGATGDYCRLSDGTEIWVLTLGQVAWFEDNSDKRTHPVGAKKPNAFGLYDMHGNVWEWTSTADGEDRLDRGGSWNGSALCCESSYRSWSSPNFWNDNRGFRLCASGKAD